MISLLLLFCYREKSASAIAIAIGAMTIWGAIEIQAMHQSTKPIQKYSKEIKSDNFCYYNNNKKTF